MHQCAHNGTMDQYRVGELRETFIEMFCTVKTAVDNPMMNPSGSGGRRAFLVIEEGDQKMAALAIGPKTKKMELKDSQMP